MSTTVTVTRTESSQLRAGETFEDVQLADYRLAEASFCAPTDRTYHKTYVTMTFDGRHTLSFRVDLQHPAVGAFRGLFEEALDFLDEVHEIGDGDAHRKAFILRGYVIAEQMFGRSSETSNAATAEA